MPISNERELGSLIQKVVAEEIRVAQNKIVARLTKELAKEKFPSSLSSILSDVDFGDFSNL